MKQTSWIGDIIIETYIDGNVAVPSGEVVEFDVVWKVASVFCLWLIELRFCITLDTKQVILETLFPASLLTSTEKTKIKNKKK